MDSRLLQDNSYHTGPLGPLTVTSHCPRLSRPTFPMTDGVSWSPLKSPLYPLVSPGVSWSCRVAVQTPVHAPPLPLPLSWDSAGGESTQWRHTVATSQLPVSGSMSVYLQTIHHHLLQMTLILDCWSNTHYNYYIVCSVHLHYNQTELFTAKMQSVPRFSLKRFNSHVILMEIFSKLNVMRLVVMYW